MRSNVVMILIFVVCAMLLINAPQEKVQGVQIHPLNVSPAVANPTVHFNYSGSLAVKYGLLIHDKYFHTKYYPSGSNLSVMQKNLDAFGSEDCAHFVSEALIAGGLTALASNPPGDNLTNYQSGYPGSYGIVGVYRLADWLAGYDLPVFPQNQTDESRIGYQPIPASYYGSPEAAVYYVENYSILPSYMLSPGDVVVDGGAGNGHAMLYIGGGEVVQTDPAAIWNYTPGVDWNVSFYGLLTLNGSNVSALYMHIPTFAEEKNVRITLVKEGRNVTNESVFAQGNGRITLIASMPNGVGFGNYSFIWTINGNRVSDQQVFTFEFTPGEYNIALTAIGSNGMAQATLHFVVNGQNAVIYVSLLIIVPTAIIVVLASLLYARRRKRS